ncbi:MAG TPA: CocE/NonD family hydrolase [Allosphingosinicella sp.]
MRAAFIFCLTLLVAAPAAGEPSRPSLPEALGAARAGATEPADLETLHRLQAAAGQWGEAEATLVRLRAAYRAAGSNRQWAVIPWQTHARARRYEAGGESTDAALARAFRELSGSLSDREFAALLPWYGATFEWLRQAQVRASEACAGVAADQCAGAAQLVAARQTLATWQYLMPASEPLIRAEIQRRFVVGDELLIPTPDGAQIAAMLVRPRASTERLTALLNFTIYARDEWSMADAVAMAARGYAGVVAYSRGKGRSPGEPVPYEHDGADAAAVIDWLAAQPWSDGRVGMFSGSYNAFTQWAAVKHRPRALRAIATSASNAPGIDTPMQGNVFQNFIYPWPLYTTAVRALDELNYGESARWQALDRNWYRSGRRYRELELIDGQPNPIFARWLDHPSYDDYWQRLIPSGREFADVDIPVFVQTGYFDGGMVGALHYAREHFRYRPNADHRMLIGPYHHFAMTQGVLRNVAGYEVDRAALIDLQDVRMQWFDHVFRGAPLPELLSGRVNFEVMGANRWRHVDRLEAMAEEPMRLYLSGRREGDRLLFGSAPDRSAAATLTVDLRDRSDAEVAVGPDGFDTRGGLVFTTQPFERPVEVAGAFAGRLEVVVNKRDFDLSVAFFEQRADGSRLPLASYLGRASYIGDRSRRRLLTPGRTHRLAFESQTVTARVIDAGGRIVAVVGVPKRPDIQINYGTGRDVSDESIADAGEPLQIRWLPGSYLELRVRRGDAGDPRELSLSSAPAPNRPGGR